MNMKFLVAVFALVAVASFAEDASESGLVREDGRGAWTFFAGPSWRSSVKMETRGSVVAPTRAKSSVSKRDMADSANWTGATLVEDTTVGGQLWSVSDKRTIVSSKAGTNYSVDISEEERPMGVNLQWCYDFAQGKNWAVGLGMRFAGYWDMESSSVGIYNAGSTHTEVWKEDYIFPDLAPDADFAPDPADKIVANGVSKLSSRSESSSRNIATRLQSDLYQIGFGPKVTFTPFAGLFDALSWLDICASAEILCNIARTDFDADGVTSSQSDCLLGFGGSIGLVGNVTDNFGLFATVGYEWIDDTSITAGDFSATTDYSSLVLSAGLNFRF